MWNAWKMVNKTRNHNKDKGIIPSCTMELVCGNNRNDELFALPRGGFIVAYQSCYIIMGLWLNYSGNQQLTTE